MNLGSIASADLLDKTAGIVIVEPTMSIAGTIRRVFLEIGYSNIYIAHSVLDAFNTLSNNAVRWIFVSPLAEEKLTQWHCLRLPLEVSVYSDLMVSVLVNPENLGLKEGYYAFGALSVHSRQITFNTFQDEIDDLLKRLAEHPTVEGAIAADVRRDLDKAKAYGELESFEEQLLKQAGETKAQKIRLIEARLKNHSNLEAMGEIQALAGKHPEEIQTLKELSQAYLGTSDIQTFRGPLPINHVLILDPDSSQQHYLRTAFHELGAETIVCCDTLEAACDTLHVGAVFDVIVTEWKLKEVKGHAFIQHVRHHGHENQPVFIHSSLVKPEDLPLIDEIGGVFIINKPSAKKQFKQFVTETIERWNSPQKGDVQIDRILSVLSAGRLGDAKVLNESFQQNAKVDKKLKLLATASIAFHEGRYAEAKELILQNAKSSVPGHREISLLGKVLLRLGDGAAALKFLEQANQMVPGNIDRLCELADANASAGKPEKALTLAKEAQKIGGDIELVQTTFAKHAVAAGEIAEAQVFLESEDAAREMISFMNNLGIAHATAQKWEESEKSYLAALQALGNRHPSLRALVSYNLGLSLARQNRLSEAVAHLRESEESAESGTIRKVQDLRERVEKSIATKQPVVLKEVLREIAAPKASQTRSASIESLAKRSKLKLHGLYGVLKPRKLPPDIDLTSEMPRIVAKLDRSADDGAE